MSSVEIIRAWKDEEYRQSLSSEQQALLPNNPANCIELADADLDQMQGRSGVVEYASPAANTTPTVCISWCLYTIQC